MDDRQCFAGLGIPGECVEDYLRVPQLQEDPCDLDYGLARNCATFVDESALSLCARRFE